MDYEQQRRWEEERAREEQRRREEEEQRRREDERRREEEQRRADEQRREEQRRREEEQRREDEKRREEDRKRHEAEIARLNEASRNNPIDAAVKAVYQQAEQARAVHDAYMRGRSGMSAPMSTDPGISSAHLAGAAQYEEEIRNNQPRSQSQIYTGSTSTGGGNHSEKSANQNDKEASSEKPKSPPHRVKTPEESFAEMDGYYGLPVQISLLSEHEKAAYLKGRKDFIVELRANPAYVVSNDDPSAYLRGDVYCPYNAYRTFNPLAAAKKAIDGTSITGKVSEGAKWCHARAAKFSKPYRDYIKNELTPYEKELERRAAMNPLKRAMLDKLNPLLPPEKTREVLQAENILYFVKWFCELGASAPKTGSGLPKASSFQQNNERKTSEETPSGTTEKRRFREVPPRSRKKEGVSEEQDVDPSTDFNAVNGQGTKRTPKGSIDFGRYACDRKYRAEIDLCGGPK